MAETLVAMLVLALVCASLYGSISVSFQNVAMTREDLRASQILVQSMEVLRLCTWSQGDPSTNFLPTSFTAPYDNTGNTNIMYQVKVGITSAPGITQIYSNDLRMVRVTATWTNNGVQRQRSMSTYVAKAGLLWYVSK